MDGSKEEAPRTRIPDLDAHLRTIIHGLKTTPTGDKAPWTLPTKTKAALVAQATAALANGAASSSSSRVRECWTNEFQGSAVDGAAPSPSAPASSPRLRVRMSGLTRSIAAAVPHSTISIFTWPQRTVATPVAGAGTAVSGSAPGEWSPGPNRRDSSPILYVPGEEEPAAALKLKWVRFANRCMPSWATLLGFCLGLLLGIGLGLGDEVCLQAAPTPLSFKMEPITRTTTEGVGWTGAGYEGMMASSSPKPKATNGSRSGRSGFGQDDTVTSSGSIATSPTVQNENQNANDTDGLVVANDLATTQNSMSSPELVTSLKRMLSSQQALVTRPYTDSQAQEVEAYETTVPTVGSSQESKPSTVGGATEKEALNSSPELGVTQNPKVSTIEAFEQSQATEAEVYQELGTTNQPHEPQLGTISDQEGTSPSSTQPHDFSEASSMFVTTENARAQTQTSTEPVVQLHPEEAQPQKLLTTTQNSLNAKTEAFSEVEPTGVEFATSKMYKTSEQAQPSSEHQKLATEASSQFISSLTTEQTSEELTTRAEASEEATTKSLAFEELTTQSRAFEELTTRAQVYEEITTRAQTSEEATTKSRAFEELITQSQAYEESTTKVWTSEEITTQAQASEEATTKSLAFEELTTQSQAFRELTTQSRAFEEPTAQAQVYEEITTRAQASEEATTKSRAFEEITTQAQASEVFQAPTSSSFPAKQTESSARVPTQFRASTEQTQAQTPPSEEVTTKPKLNASSTSPRPTFDPISSNPNQSPEPGGTRGWSEPKPKPKPQELDQDLAYDEDTAAAAAEAAEAIAQAQEQDQAQGQPSKPKKKKRSWWDRVVEIVVGIVNKVLK